MAIEFCCPHCGKDFSVKGEHAGKKAKCKCGATIVVPSGPIVHRTHSATTQAQGSHAGPRHRTQEQRVSQETNGNRLSRIAAIVVVSGMAFVFGLLGRPFLIGNSGNASRDGQDLEGSLQFGYIKYAVDILYSYDEDRPLNIGPRVLKPGHVAVSVPVTTRQAGTLNLASWYLVDPDGRQYPVISQWMKSQFMWGVGTIETSGPDTLTFLFEIPIGVNWLDMYAESQLLGRVVKDKIREPPPMLSGPTMPKIEVPNFDPSSIPTFDPSKTPKLPKIKPFR